MNNDRSDPEKTVNEITPAIENAPLPNPFSEILEGEADSKSTPANKTCPYCKEEIKFDAIKCKHCQAMLIERPRRTSDGMAFFLALVMGPVGLWYKGHWMAGFAWLAAIVVIAIVMGAWGLLIAPLLWIFMAAHAYDAKERD